MGKKESHQLTGVAGVHYVASYLSHLGFHAVPTTRNVAGPDVLVSTLDGSKGVSLQVKTTISAIRTRGRGAAKRPHHCEWDVGHTSSKVRHRNLYFALVDLKGFETLPDVYVVPSQVIYDYFNDGKIRKRARYHPELKEIDPYRNKWDVIRRALQE